MKDINPRADQFPEYRQAVRELCAQFPSQYWQRIETAAAYPEEFVQALTHAGWLAALIPTEYGGGLRQSGVFSLSIPWKAAETWRALLL